jgi:hypothetical protein
MIKGPEEVDKFLSYLSFKLQPLWRVEKAEMLKLKKEKVNKFSKVHHQGG